MLKPLILCFSFHDTDSNIRVFQEDGRLLYKFNSLKTVLSERNLDSWTLGFSSDHGWFFIRTLDLLKWIWISIWI